VKPKIYSHKSRVDCENYRANISAAACRARFEKAEEHMTTLRKRRGEHLRQANLIGCKGCETGQSVQQQLVQISLRKKKVFVDFPKKTETHEADQQDESRTEESSASADIPCQSRIGTG
jgi:hypothetical protein